MPEITLEDRTIRRLIAAQLKGESPRVEYADLLRPGLRLRITRSGSASWSVLFRIKGREGQFRKTLGPYPRVTLAEARSLAREDLNRAAEGQDPRVKLRPRALLFEDLVDLYVAHIKARNRSWRLDYLRIQKDLLPRWKGRPAQEIVRADVIALRSEIAARGVTVPANTLSTVSKLFAWGVGEDLVSSNPAYRVKTEGRAKAGTRWLRDEELARVVRELLSVRSRMVFARVLLARVLLGQRTRETIALEWEDTADGWWELPPTLTKNKLPHRVPLIPLVKEWILEPLRSVTGGEKWVFYSPRRGSHINESSVTAFTNEFSAEIGIAFDARDLRRTYVTQLARLGVARETRQKLINHRAGFDTIDLHYDLYDYDAEKLVGAMRWEAHLRSLLNLPPA